MQKIALFHQSILEIEQIPQFQDVKDQTQF